jgi:nitroreductase
MRNPTDVEVHPLVAARWSPRAFSERAIPPEVLRRVLEASRWAPSAFNEQPWRFLVAARDADPDGHARLAGVLNDWNRAWAARAPVLIVVAAATRYRRNDQANRTADFDTGGATAWLVAQATADGLFAHPMGGFSVERARALGLPDGVEPICMLALGYLGDPGTLSEELQVSEARVRERLPLAHTVHGAAWGTPVQGADGSPKRSR